MSDQQKIMPPVDSPTAASPLEAQGTAAPNAHEDYDLTLEVASDSQGELTEDARDCDLENESVDDSSSAELDKIYGLPIPEIEELLRAQQEAQARAYKIVRHLRAAQDKISVIKDEKRQLIADLRNARQTARQLQGQLESLQNQERTSQLAAESLQNLVKQHEAKITEQSTSIAKLNELIDTSRKKLLDLQHCREELVTLKKSSEEREQEVESLRSEYATLEAENEKLRIQIDDSKSEREDLVKLMRAAMERLEKHRQK